MMDDYGKDHDAPDDQLAIERLVDGELAEDARRQLLSSLDFKPDGWRQLALAFVEAQTLQQELGAMIAGPPPSARSRQVPASTTRSFWLRPAGMVLAMSACFLAALSLGLIFRAQPERQGSDVAVAGAEGATAEDRLVESPAPPAPLVEPAPVAGLPQVPPAVAQTAVEESAAAARLTLPVTGGVRGNDVWSQVQKPALPLHIQQLLKQLGHRVQVRRVVVPLDLPDGRRVVVPVEEFDVRFVGEEDYQ